MKDQNVHFSKTFVEGEFHLGFWSFVKKGFSFLDSFFILRSLSLYQYGVYQLLLSLYAALSDFFHDLFGSVTSNDIARAISEGKQGEAKRLFFEYSIFRIAMAVIACLLGFGAASFFSFRYGPDALLWVRLLSVLFIVEALLSLATTLLKVHLAYKTLAIRPSLQKLIQALILGYFFFFAELSLKEVFLATILAPAITLLWLLPQVIRVYRPWRSVRMASSGILGRIVRSYGFWELPQSILRNLIGKMRPWIIKIFLNTEAVGIFGIAMTAISLLKDLLPIRTLSSLVPRSADNPDKMQKIFVYGTKYYVLMSIVLIIAGAVGYPLGITLLFPQFSPSFPLFYLLLPTVILFAFIKLTNIFLVVKRRQKFIFFQGMLEQGISIILLIVSLPVLGIIGVALAETVAILISVGVKYWYLTKTRFIAPIPLRQFLSITPEDRQYFGIMRSHIFRIFRRT